MRVLLQEYLLLEQNLSQQFIAGLPDTSDEFSLDNVLIKSKNIDGVCANIDCTNNLLFCNSLEDC
jgi:hypothetical protein